MRFSITSQLLPDGRRSESSSMFRHTEYFAFNDPNNRRLKIETARCEGMQINRVASSGHSIRLTEDKHGTYLIPRRGAIEIETVGDSFSGAAGSAFAFSPNSRTTRVSPCGSQSFRASVLLVDMPELRTYLEADEILVGPDYVEQQFGGRLAMPEEKALRDYILFLERELLARPSAFANPRVERGASALARELFGQLFLRLQSTSTELPDDGGLNMAYAKRAEEIMRARLDEPLTVAQIAVATGVSVRRLQLIFRKLRQTTPRQALTEFRLEKVHSLLADQSFESSVFQAALDCGFTHLGRFAASYRARFGELPSETLRQTRRSRTN